MTEKPKRKYTRRKKAMTAATLDGFQEGLAFATDTLTTKDGAEYLRGHMQGMAFALKNAPTTKARRKPGPKPGAKKPGPKPKAAKARRKAAK